MLHRIGNQSPAYLHPRRALGPWKNPVTPPSRSVVIDTSECLSCDSAACMLGQALHQKSLTSITNRPLGLVHAR